MKRTKTLIQSYNTVGFENDKPIMGVEDSVTLMLSPTEETTLYGLMVAIGDNQKALYEFIHGGVCTESHVRKLRKAFGNPKTMGQKMTINFYLNDK